MVSRVSKWVGGLEADLTDIANVHATENRIAFGHGDTNPTANVHVVGNAHITTSFSTGGNITSGGSVTGTSADFDGGVTIDNITIDGTEIDLSSGDLTIDAAGKIVLDADNTGGFTEFHDGGTAYGSISQDSNNMRIRSLINNGDVIIQGLNGSGSLVNMAQFYGDQAGAVKLFNNLMLQSDGAFFKFGDNNDIDITHVHEVGLTLTNRTTGDNKPIVFQLKSTEGIVTADEVIASIEMAAGDASGTDAAEVAAGIHAIAEGTFAADANPTKLVFTTGVSESASASATAKMTLSSAGLLTIADDFIIKDAGTIGSASDPDAIAIGADGDVTLTQDLELQHDGATISFGTNDEIVLEHVHDTGLLLKDTGGSPTLQLHDSGESVSSDGSKLILTSNGVAFNLPTADGSAGQVLKTDGSRTLSFTDVSTDTDPATSLASDTDCGALSGATEDTKDAFGIAVDDALAELDLRTQGANKLGTVDMGALS